MDAVRDLSVHMDSRSASTDHVSEITRKAFQMLGFIRRTTGQFTDPRAINLLYNSLVLNHLEYASVVRLPYYQRHKCSLERVQSRPLRYLSYTFGVAADVSVVTLEQRRELSDMLFLHKLVNNSIDCAYLTERRFFFC